MLQRDTFSSSSAIVLGNMILALDLFSGAFFQGGTLSLHNWCFVFVFLLIVADISLNLYSFSVGCFLPFSQAHCLVMKGLDG